MKLLLVMFMVFSATTFAAEVGENMKSECTKIISEERAKLDTASSEEVEVEETTDVISQ